MRLRNKPWAPDKLASYPQYISNNPKDLRGKWQTRFEKKQDIFIEIGSGKGQFIIGMAEKYPDFNFIAIELQTSVIVSILEKQIEKKLPNLQLINGHGGDLLDFFAPGEISRIYLNFSDPWPKTRHTKRRLTSPEFLEIYRQILPDSGEIHFKTDNMGLFEYSLSSLSQFGYAFRQVWLDLHQSDYIDNIETEYEQKFSAKGQAIYRLEAYWPTNKTQL